VIQSSRGEAKEAARFRFWKVCHHLFWNHPEKLGHSNQHCTKATQSNTGLGQPFPKQYEPDQTKA